jgi:hypothetical protein
VLSSKIGAYTVTYTTLDSSVYLSFVAFDLQPVFVGDELGAHYTPTTILSFTAPSEVDNSADELHARIHALGQSNRNKTLC